MLLEGGDSILLFLFLPEILINSILFLQSSTSINIHEWGTVLVFIPCTAWTKGFMKANTFKIHLTDKYIYLWGPLSYTSCINILLGCQLVQSQTLVMTCTFVARECIVTHLMLSNAVKLSGPKIPHFLTKYHSEISTWLLPEKGWTHGCVYRVDNYYINWRTNRSVGFYITRQPKWLSLIHTTK